MTNDGKGVSAPHVAAMLAVILLVVPITSVIGTRWIGVDKNLMAGICAVLIGLGFHVVNTLFAGPFPFIHHLKQIALSIAAGIVCFVALRFIDRLFE